MGLAERFEEYWQKMMKEGQFQARDFVAAMEPAFQEAGYREPRPVGERQEILVVRDDAAGDFVLFSGFLRELRRLYPTAHITLVVSPRGHELAQCCPYVDNLELNREEYDPKDFPAGFRSTMDFVIERLLSHHFDLAFCARLGIQCMSVLMEYMCGAKQRVAFSQNRPGMDGEVVDTGWDSLLTLPVPFPTTPRHDVDMNFLLLDYMLRLPVVNRSPEVWYTRQDEDFGLERLKGFQQAKKRVIAVVPGASLPSKQWPVESYAAVMKGILAKEPQTAFVVLGGPSDKALGQRLQRALGKKLVLNMAGRTNFRQSAALLHHCALYLGNDTGLLHIAATLGRPVLSVNCFPASLPTVQSSIPLRFYPYHVPAALVMPKEPLDDCADNYRYGCGRNHEVHCIRQVKPETVLQGYDILQHRIAAGDKTTIFLK